MSAATAKAAASDDNNKGGKHAFTPEDLRAIKDQVKTQQKAEREEAKRDRRVRDAILLGKANSKVLYAAEFALDGTELVTEVTAETGKFFFPITLTVVAETMLAPTAARIATLAAATPALAGTALATGPAAPVVLAGVGLAAGSVGVYKGLKGISTLSRRGSAKVRTMKQINDAWVFLAEAEMIDVETFHHGLGTN